MAYKQVNGANGANGSSTAGATAGANAIYYYAGNGTSTANKSTVIGGAGGSGNPSGGAGANGGYAKAKTVAAPQVNSANGVYGGAYAFGGSGGNAGDNPPHPAGDDVPGGSAGNAYAGAAASNTAGTARAVATARGGNGGLSIGPGETGGAGGAATIVGVVTASGTSAVAKATQQGGVGGSGTYGANGAAGPASTLNNVVSGSTTGGTFSSLQLLQYAIGGQGGFSAGGAPGAGGYGKSTLSFNDDLNAKQAHSLYATSGAGGGEAGEIEGAGGTAPAGGGATAALSLTGANLVSATVTALAGQGGSVGNYGSLQLGDANGGTGGAAYVAQGVAASTSATGTAGVAAKAVGGAGGEADGAGKHGGAGGAAVVAPVSAGGFNATASANQVGGNGGGGLGGASGGNGQGSTLANDVTAATTGGTLMLIQEAQGGAGGFSYGAGAGAGGAGQSTLTFSDHANPTAAASLIGHTYAYGGAGGSGEGGSVGTTGATATTYAYLSGSNAVTAQADSVRAGAGGSSGPGLAGANGGTATAAAKAKSTTTSANVTAGAQATGGAGGAGYASGGSGGTGGAATGASAAAYAPNAVSGLAYAAATQTGGAGGAGHGAGFNGGSGGAATGTTATAQGYSVKAFATQTGGAGGNALAPFFNGYYHSSNASAAGGAGANSVLANAVGGQTGGGDLYLQQTATGGNGGRGYANGGAGGYATDTLTFDDTKNATAAKLVHGEVIATGGNSGASGQGGHTPFTAVPAGGNAMATQKLTGAKGVYANSYATGGTGGAADSGAMGGGAGGGAGAYASAQSTTAGRYNASASASATGGTGGLEDGSGSGGAGGGVGSTYAVACAPGATGNRASASVTEHGGAGGAAFGAGNAGGSGGTVKEPGGTVAGNRPPAATALGFNAIATVEQVGGSGGAGLSGATGGAGASVDVGNAVYGKAYGGYLYLTQGATGGNSGGAGGAAGQAGSYLTFADTLAAALKGNTVAIGGGGGAGAGTSNGSTGGAADATAHMTGAKTVTALAQTQGGQGGVTSGTGTPGTGGATTAGAVASSSATGASPSSATAAAYAGGGGGVQSGGTGNGGYGGAATGVYAQAGSGNAGQAVAKTVAQGGAGGVGVGAGKHGGAGGIASGSTATASGYAATAIVMQTGGAGGAGSGGASGGTGAASSLDDAVFATTDGGPLSLRQTAVGGAGGGSAAANAGTGGNAYSGLTYDAAAPAVQPRSATAVAAATGGAGGYGTGGSNGGNGGHGIAVVNLTGTAGVTAHAYGTGGNGGSSSVSTGAGGYATATATAIAQGTAAADTASASASAIGGTGTGLLEGNATPAATARTADGQLAIANTNASGLTDDAAATASTTQGPTTGVVATAVITGGTGSLAADSSAEFGGIVPVAGFDIDDAYADALPSTTSVDSILSQAAYGSINVLLGGADTAATLVGYGLEAGVSQTSSGASQVATLTQTYTVTQAELSGTLYLGLLAGQSVGSGFTNLVLQVTIAGAVVLNAAFSSASAAQAYFNDDALNLGNQSAQPNGTTISVGLTVTAAANDSGYAASFLLGSTGVNSPPAVTAPASVIAGQTRNTPVPGISVGETGNTAGETFGATVTDSTGLLTATGTGVSGSGTTTLTIAGDTLGQLDAALASLHVQEPAGSETTDTIVVNATDSLGGASGPADIAVSVTGMPTLSGPVAVAVVAGSASPVENVATPPVTVTLAEPGAVAGETFTVTAKDGSGVLSVTPAGTTVTGNGSTNLTISGTLANVNAALASLTDTEPGPAADTITVAAQDSLGNTSATESIAVVRGPVLAGFPLGLTVGEIGSTAIAGVSISEAAAPAGEMFSVGLTDTNGLLSASAAGGATVSGEGTDALAIAGTLAEVNAALGTLTDEETRTASDTLVGRVEDLDTLAASGSSDATIQVADSAFAVDNLTTAEVATLAANGVTQIVTSGTDIYLTVAQVQSLAGAGISVHSAGEVFLDDTAANLAAIPGTAAGPISAVGVTDLYANNGDLILGAGPGSAFIAAGLQLQSLTHTVSLTSSAIAIELASPSEITQLQSGGVTNLIATDTSVALTAAEASDLLTASISVTAQMGAVSVTDTAAHIEALAAGTPLGRFNGIGVSQVVAAGSLVFTLGELEGFAGVLPVTVTAGNTIAAADTAAAIEATSASQLSTIVSNVPLAGIQSTDASVRLSVAQAEVLESTGSGVPVPVLAPAGDLVALADTAADIEAMTPAQLAGLIPIGVSQVDVTDASVTLTVAQALALLDPVPIVVPPGDLAVVSDTESAVEALTPAEITGLASIGISTIEVSNVTGAAPLTVDGGITLDVGGAIPASQAIHFVGTGGTLEVDATPDLAGTLYGFSPPDTLDLSDVPYDPAGSATLDPSGDNVLDVVANGTTYPLQLDPSQVFPTQTTFATAPDSLTGTDLTVVEAPLSFQPGLVAGQTVAGLDVLAGIVFEVVSGVTADRTVLEPGAKLVVDDGAAEADTFLEGNAVLDLQSGADGSGVVAFSTAMPGGTFEVDDTSPYAGTITGLAPGDSIDLAAFAYDPNGSASLQPGNVLQVTGNGAVEDVQLDTLQDFAGQYFHLAPDASGEGTLVTESTTACYCRGTRIATPAGQVPIEQLRIGDGVLTHAGGTRPIQWIGRRSYAGRFAMRNPAVMPVLIRANALADEVPERDLYVSPRHAMFLDGVLVPARELVNGTSIVQIRALDAVEYVHLELATHDVILAEGAWSESFMDDNSRGMFDNAAEWTRWNPGLRKAPAISYAQRIESGAVLDAIRKRLSRIAGGPARHPGRNCRA